MFTVCGEDLIKFNGQNGTKFFDEKPWIYRMIGALHQGHHCSKGIYKGSLLRALCCFWGALKRELWNGKEGLEDGIYVACCP